MVGKVKWFDPTRGYGFIARGDGQGDLFVHTTDLALGGEHRSDRPLTAGEAVAFEVAPGTKGPRAIHVRRVPETTG